jgi:hypothetical protein
MTSPKDLAPDQVEQVMQNIIRQEPLGGPDLTVTGLAAALHVKRAAFYYAFPEVVVAIAEHRNRKIDHGKKGRPRDERALTAESALRTTRKERDALAGELAIYADQIRVLTIENVELRKALETATGVRRIGL